jgi:predicted O-methyltransferase YrrM
MNLNPYGSRRTLPVGKLSYPCKFNVNKVSAALEYGEKELLYDIPRMVGINGVYCNLGELYGGSSILMALGILDQKLQAEVWTVDIDEKCLARAKKNYYRFGVENVIAQFHGSSGDCAKDFKDNRFNFVFIDADHSFKYTKNDIINYLPLVVPGGYIGLHDTNQDDVDRAIKEIGLDKLELVEWVNRIKVFKKP